MIHYHGSPITPETAFIESMQGSHAFLSFGSPLQRDAILSVCQSFAIDNGAFAAWRAGKPITDWAPFYAWADDCRRFPTCDFAVIPDVIDGDEAANDALLAEWPLPREFGAPVWHMHESFERLARLAAEWPRVCLGSSGEFATVGDDKWWGRMSAVMLVCCHPDGRPVTKLHGLRMLNPAVFSRLPLASADSTNVARNIGVDKRWTGSYQPSTKGGRAALIRSRIEAQNAPVRWAFDVPPIF